MAQIKNIKKPGDLIRGAKVGVAGLDKDGNVIGTGIDTEDIATFPEGAQNGDVLAWGGETGPEWRPHYPESGSEGDVLTLGETGPEWAQPSGGGTYNHYVTVNDDVTLHIVTDSPTPFTLTTLKAYLVKIKNDNNINPYSYYRLAGIGSNGTSPYCPLCRIEFGGVGQNDGQLHVSRIVYSIVDGALSSDVTTKNISLNSPTTINDIVG